MLSQKSRYALRALAVLAEHDDPAPLSIQEIAARADAPRKFLEAILLELRKDGVLTSARGKLGGYALAAPAEEIKLSRIIRALDGPLAPIACASLYFYQPCADCPDPNACTTRGVMREVRDAVNEVLDARTIADLTPDRAGARKRPKAGKPGSPKVLKRQGR
jgi:Rrf2 family protein